MLHTDLEPPQLLHGADQAPSPSTARPKRMRLAPGSMRLRAVREGGRIVDFRWEFVSAAAAALLHCTADELLGLGLSETVSGGPLGHPALIDRYRRVLEHGNAQSFAQVHVIDGHQDVVVHRVVRMGDGVAVTLTNLSADRRKQAWRLEHAGHGMREPTQQRTTQ